MAKDNGDCRRSASIGKGQKIIADFGRDNSGYDVAGAKGESMGGSITNLSHSISGGSAVQKVTK